MSLKKFMTLSLRQGLSLPLALRMTRAPSLDWYIHGAVSGGLGKNAEHGRKKRE